MTRPSIDRFRVIAGPTVWKKRSAARAEGHALAFLRGAAQHDRGDPGVVARRGEQEAELFHGIGRERDRPAQPRG